MERLLFTSNQSRFNRAAARLVLVTAAALVVLGILPAPRALAAVTVTSFGARFQNSQVLVTWRTASELNNLGFIILRSTTGSGTYAKISGVIPSQSPGSIMGGFYSYTDSNVTVGQTYFYKLQALERGGGIQQFGPVSTDPSAGIPTATPTKTNTAIPPSVTPTRTVVTTATSTVAPTATATPPATGTSSPTVTGTPPATPVLTVTGTPLAKIAIAATLPSGKPSAGKVPAATPQSVPSQPEAPQIAPLPSPAAEALEESSQEVAPEDQRVDPSPASPDLRPLVSILFFGLSGVFGLGALVLGILGLVLFARTHSRR